MSVAIADFCLCAECLGKFLRADPARAEYDWYVARVRRELVGPMLRGGNVIEIERYRALRREAR